MSVETWGEMPKSQDDNQTVEERIAELIAAHNDDPESHLGDTGSLHSHKTSEIIDHEAKSIINDKILSGELSQDKLSSTQFQLYTCFESLDGWQTGGAEIGVALMGAKIGTGGTSGNDASFVAEAYGYDPVLNLDKSSSFTLSLSCDNNTHQTIYVGHFNDSFDETTCGYGFKIVDGQLYCVVFYGDGDTSGEDLTAVSGFANHVTLILRAELDTDLGEIRFYLNGVLLHTSTRSVAGLTDSQFFTMDIKTNENAAKRMYPRSLLFARDI